MPVVHPMVRGDVWHGKGGSSVCVGDINIIMMSDFFHPGPSLVN